MASGSEKKKDKTKIKGNYACQGKGQTYEEGESKDKRLYRKAKQKDGR